jgi:hypothetical protein
MASQDTYRGLSKHEGSTKYAMRGRKIIFFQEEIKVRLMKRIEKHHGALFGIIRIRYGA